jgi:hypothetical protein
MSNEHLEPAHVMQCQEVRVFPIVKELNDRSNEMLKWNATVFDCETEDWSRRFPDCAWGALVTPENFFVLDDHGNPPSFKLPPTIAVEVDPGRFQYYLEETPASEALGEVSLEESHGKFSITVKGDTRFTGKNANGFERRIVNAGVAIIERPSDIVIKQIREATNKKTDSLVTQAKHAKTKRAMRRAWTVLQDGQAFLSKQIKPLIGIDPVDETAPGEFKYPRVAGPNDEYIFEQKRAWDLGIMGNLIPGYEGWFARGSVHLVGGVSGAGKSRFMLPRLKAQFHCEPVLGHRTFGHPYLVLLADRDEGALERSLNGMDPEIAEHCVLLADGSGVRGVQAAIEMRYEETGVLPVVVFIEGIDFVLGNVNDADTVGPLMGSLMKVARHYRIAMIGSLGSAKLKTKEQWAAKRSALIGSQAWARRAETVMVIEGEDDSQRNLTVQSRNGKAEKYSLAFDISGNLHETEIESPVEMPLPKFAKERAQGEDGWFTVLDFQNHSGMSKAYANRLVKDAYDGGLLRQKPGPKGGGAALYRWGQSPESPATTQQLGQQLSTNNC